MLAGTITNAPHVPRVRSLLDSRTMVHNPVEVFERYRKELGPTFTFHFGGARGVIASTNPRFIQHVLQKNNTNYHMSDIRVKRMGEFQGQGLLNSHGDTWLKKRRFLSRGFHHSRLADLLPMQKQVVDGMFVRLDREIERGPIDVHRLMVGCTFRLVGRSLFGGQMTDGDIDRLGSTITTIQAFMVRQIVHPYLIPWFRLTGRSRGYQRMRLRGEQIVREHIDARRSDRGENRCDMLQMLLDTPFDESGDPLDPDQVLIEIMQLLVAGNETSPVALSWALYLLARHPEFVPRIREEVEAAFGTEPVTLSGLYRLPLTLRVLDETMRLYPSFWMIDRVALQDDVADGIRIPAGTTVAPYIYGTHRNPEIWDDPESFDPSRFEDDAKKDRHPFAHIPFGGGPRKCIGSNMALAQMLLILASFVRRYDFELASPEPVGIDPLMILHPAGPIEMSLTRVG